MWKLKSKTFNQLIIDNLPVNTALIVYNCTCIYLYMNLKSWLAQKKIHFFRLRLHCYDLNKKFVLFLMFHLTARCPDRRPTDCLGGKVKARIWREKKNSRFRECLSVCIPIVDITKIIFDFGERVSQRASPYCTPREELEKNSRCNIISNYTEWEHLSSFFSSGFKMLVRF